MNHPLSIKWIYPITHASRGGGQRGALNGLGARAAVGRCPVSCCCSREVFPGQPAAAGTHGTGTTPDGGAAAAGARSRSITTSDQLTAPHPAAKVGTDRGKPRSDRHSGTEWSGGGSVWQTVTTHRCIIQTGKPASWAGYSSGQVTTRHWI